MRDYKQAAAKFSLAIDLNNTVATYWNNRGLANYKLGRFNEALHDFSEALSPSRDPNDGNIYFNRGNTYLAMKVLCYLL